MAKKTYAEMLQHPRWQQRRLEVLNHYGWTCQDCGETEVMLHVHHKQYVRGRAPWEYATEELEVLCKDCHHAEHFPEVKPAQKVRQAPSLARVLIQAILCQPALVSLVDFATDLSSGIEHSEELGALRQVVRHLTWHGASADSVASLLTKYEGTETGLTLAFVLADAPNWSDPEEVRAEFDGAMERLREQIRRAQAVKQAGIAPGREVTPERRAILRRQLVRVAA
jgi:hypothetical protein